MYLFDPGAPPVTLLEAATSWTPPRLVQAAVAVALVGFSTMVVQQYHELTTQAKRLSQRRNEAEKVSTEHPASPKLAWDLARVTLEQYFYRNLRQVSQIFYTALVVMIVGFALIVYGAVVSVNTHASDLPSKLAVLSGIVTEFIGLTFMVIYRSTLQQANSYMSILEKINAVGMAVQIVESIPESNELCMQTRAAMAKMLLEQFLPASKPEKGTE